MPADPEYPQDPCHFCNGTGFYWPPTDDTGTVIEWAITAPCPRCLEQAA